MQSYNFNNVEPEMGPSFVDAHILNYCGNNAISLSRVAAFRVTATLHRWLSY
jgi:hypothetical protein